MTGHWMRRMAVLALLLAPAVALASGDSIEFIQ